MNINLSHRRDLRGQVVRKGFSFHLCLTLEEPRFSVSQLLLRVLCPRGNLTIIALGLDLIQGITRVRGTWWVFIIVHVDHILISLPLTKVASSLLPVAVMHLPPDQLSALWPSAWPDPGPSGSSPITPDSWFDWNRALSGLRCRKYPCWVRDVASQRSTKIKYFPGIPNLPKPLGCPFPSESQRGSVWPFHQGEAKAKESGSLEAQK